MHTDGRSNSTAGSIVFVAGRKNSMNGVLTGILSLILSSVLLAQENPAPCALCPRVGEEIDRNERRYFGLFPAVNNFVSAKTFIRADSGFEIAIIRQNPVGTETSIVTVDAERARELGSFIDDFEMVARREKEPRWDLLLSLARIPIPSHAGNVEAIITTKGGEKQAGTLLYATDSLLVLWQTSSPYNWRNLNKFGRIFKATSIQNVLFEREGHFGAGLGYGLLIGVGTGALIGLASGDNEEGGFFRFNAGEKALIGGVVLGVPATIIGGIAGALQGIDDDFAVGGDKDKYKAIVPTLREDANFSYLPSPEIAAFLSQRAEEIPEPSSHTFGENPPSQSAGQIHDPSSAPTPCTFHISVDAAWFGTQANNDMIDAFNASGFGGTEAGWFGSIDYPVDFSSLFAWTIGAEYNITDQYRAGFSQSKIPEQEIHGRNFEVESARATSTRLFIDYVIAPVDPMLASRYEVAIGAGLSYNSLSVDGNLNSIFGSDSYTVSKTVVGMNLRGSVDYYVSRNFSLQGKIEARFLPGISIPGQTYVNPTNNSYFGDTKTLARHTINFSGVDFSVGLRFHL